MLYPSWPGLVLLLWAVVIWVIPRVNPKQSLQYSSPLLVVYAIGLLLLSFVNALPVTSKGFTWGFKVGIECQFETGYIEDCLSEALGAKVGQCRKEPLYNGHHWDQRICPFNRDVLCQGVIFNNIVSKWAKNSVSCREVSIIRRYSL